ncbi:TRAP transporter small permease [Rhodobacteraceae bacterium D3-12]|nr:TRAP transporter small permease [Rhodobacteraceae bacterium D3-12]
MALVHRLTRHVCALCMFVAAVAVAGLTVLILTEIILRSVFSSSMLVTEELAGYLVSAAITLALAPTFHDGAMIRLTLISSRLRAGPQRILELILTLVALVVALYWARYILRSVLKLFDRGSSSSGVIAFPLWLPEAIALFGVASLALVLLAHSLQLLTQGLDTGEGSNDHGV